MRQYLVCVLLINSRVCDSISRVCDSISRVCDSIEHGCATSHTWWYHSCTQRGLCAVVGRIDTDRGKTRSAVLAHWLCGAHRRPRKKLFKNTRRTRRLVASVGKSGVRSSGRRVVGSLARVFPGAMGGRLCGQRVTRPASAKKNFSKHPTHPTPRRQPL